MSLSRPQTVKAQSAKAADLMMSQIAPYVMPRHLGKVRKFIESGTDWLADSANETYRRVPDKPGYMVLVRTNNPRRPNVFGLYFTIQPDYRLRMAQRDIPTETLIEVVRIPVLKVRTARETILAEIEEKDGVRLLHDTWFTVEGGAQRIRPFVERKVRMLDRRLSGKIGRPAVRSTIDTPKTIVVRKRQPA